MTAYPNSEHTVTLADIASPNPSPQAQAVLDKATKAAFKAQEKVTEAAKLGKDTTP